MCLFRTPKPKPMRTPPPIKPRIEEDSSLPVAKEMVDPDETSDVSYGSSKKKAGPAAAKKTGAAGLKIPLNAGNTSGAQTGGLNV